MLGARVSRLVPLLLAGLLVAGCASSPPTSPPTSATTSSPAPERASGLVPPTAATSPQELAERLRVAELTARSRTAGDAEVRQAAFEGQLLYRQLARQEAWHQPVLDRLPRWLRGVARAHVAARRDFRSMHSSLSSTLPAWRIVPPAPVADLRSFYRQGERRFGVPWEVLAAVNLVETGFGRIRGTSVAGARGPMQFMPATWAAYGRGDIDDPHDAILAAARYLAANGGGRGQVARALYAYNHHPAYVRGVQAYAAVLRAQPRALTGLHHWQVVYLSTRGDVWLPQGYEQARPTPVARYLRAHPDRRLGTRTD